MPSAGLNALDRSSYQVAFTDDFTGARLDPGRWIARYLPQWTTPDRSAARYELRDGWLRLRIDADQPAWRPEDGELRVSNLQTATFSGPLGSPRGTHRHQPGPPGVLQPRDDRPARRGRHAGASW